MAAVGHAKDGVVYDGRNAKAAQCYQVRMPRNVQSGQNAADSAAADDSAEKNDALLALLDSAIPTGISQRDSLMALDSITDADRQKMATAAWTAQ